MKTETIPLTELQLTKYLPFTVRGRIGSPQGITAIVKATDAEVGDIKWTFILGAADKSTLPHPTHGVEMITHDSIKVITRSLVFSSSSTNMHRQNMQTNVSVPLFSTLIKFLTWFIEQERLKVPFEKRTGMISFMAASGGTSARPDINARDRVYALLVKQLEHQGLCVMIEHRNDDFSVMLKDFVNVAIRANLMRRV
jgi:hypothetical protein